MKLQCYRSANGAHWNVRAPVSLLANKIQISNTAYINMTHWRRSGTNPIHHLSSQHSSLNVRASKSHNLVGLHGLVRGIALPFYLNIKELLNLKAS
jgi:hypothetical protein